MSSVIRCQVCQFFTAIFKPDGGVGEEEGFYKNHQGVSDRSGFDSGGAEDEIYNPLRRCEAPSKSLQMEMNTARKKNLSMKVGEVLKSWSSQ
jgi:hypothetical protein